MKKRIILLVLLSIFSVLALADECGTTIDKFIGDYESIMITFPTDGGIDDSVGIEIPRDSVVESAILDLTGIPLLYSDQNPVDVTLVTDVSDSMGFNCHCLDGSLSDGGVCYYNNTQYFGIYTEDYPCKIDDAKSADRLFAEILLNGSENLLGLVSYSSSLSSFIDLTSDNTTIQDEIDSYLPTSRTCISCGINKAREVMASSIKEDKYIIVMTDGIANKCLGGSCTDYQAKLQAIEQASLAYNLSDIRVYAVAFGDDADLDVMEQIALAGNGSFYIANETNIEDVYVEIAGDILEVYPTDTDMDHGENTVFEWEHPGLFDGNEQDIHFEDELNSFLPDCTCSGCSIDGDLCSINFAFGSESAGKLLVENLSILYHPETDPTCDGIDDDCDGIIDDDYESLSCGEGLCGGLTECIETPAPHIECWTAGSMILGEDCGVCCLCDGPVEDPYESYDETQDSDCPATVCTDSCSIDSNPYTWDYADDVENECIGMRLCRSYDCSYDHVCRDDDPDDGINGNTCGAECDQDTDCTDKCMPGEIRYYDGNCALDGDCSCSWDSQIDCDDFDDDYYVDFHCDAQTGDIYNWYEDWVCSLGDCEYSGLDWKHSLEEDCFDRCTDPDSQDFFTQETVTDEDLCVDLETECPSSSYTDYCIDPDYLNEYICFGDDYSYVEKDCSDYDCSTPMILDCIGVGSDTIYEEGDSYGCSAGACGIVGSTACSDTWVCDENRLCDPQSCGPDSPICSIDTSYDYYWGTPQAVEQQCDDGIDNDCDGYIDCEDPDCRGMMGPAGAICCHELVDCPSDECSEAICLPDYTCSWEDSPDGSSCSGDPGICCSGVCDDDGIISNTGFDIECRSGPVCIDEGEWGYSAANEGYECGDAFDYNCDSVSTGGCDGSYKMNTCGSGYCSGQVMVFDDDSQCNGLDCGTCCICGADGIAGYDETQDDDCSIFEQGCADSCTNIPDGISSTWDYADDITSECLSVGTCTNEDAECSYQHTCEESLAGSCPGWECDDDDDCAPYLDQSDYCHYDNGCSDACDCTDGPQEYCPPLGQVGDICYYGTRDCIDIEGCTVEECTLEWNEYCDPILGCTEKECVDFDSMYDDYREFTFPTGGATVDTMSLTLPVDSEITSVTSVFTGYPVNQSPDKELDLVLVTDVSDSMVWNCHCLNGSLSDKGLCEYNGTTMYDIYSPDYPCKLVDAKEAGIELMENVLQFEGNDYAGLVSYSSGIVSSLPMTQEISLLTDEIESYVSVASTCISCGIAEATALISSDPHNPTKAMIVMTDGEANRCLPDGHNCATSTAKLEAIAKAGEAYDLHGITVYAVAFGEDADYDTMQEIALAGNGEAYYASETNISEVYQTILSKITQVYPTDPEMEAGGMIPVEWSFVGEFLGPETAGDYSDEIFDILRDCADPLTRCPSCSYDGTENTCTISLEHSSKTAGILGHDLSIEGCEYVEPTCDTDDECDSLDRDYCSGDLVMHDEGRCVDEDCIVETTVYYDCTNDNEEYCDGTVAISDSYTCQDAACVIDSSIEHECVDGLYCNGPESCSAGACVSGVPVDCSQYDLLEISVCDNSPDDNPYTFDYAGGFDSVCDEDLDACTQSVYDYMHTCDVVSCGAECDDMTPCTDTDCDNLDGCVGNDYYDYDDVTNVCLSDCTCEDNQCTAYSVSYDDPRCECTENSDCDDGFDCTVDSCISNECHNDIDTDSCLIGGVCYDDGDPDPANPCRECMPDISQVSWSDDDSNICGVSRDCPDNGCVEENMTSYPVDGHDFCMSGVCQEYSCEPTSSYYDEVCVPSPTIAVGQDEDTYCLGDTVHISGTLFDEYMVPIEGEEIAILVSADSAPSFVDQVLTGSAGEFTTSFTLPSDGYEGEYTVYANYGDIQGLSIFNAMSCVIEKVVVNEFVSDPADGDVEWIELYNVGPDPVSLDAWTIEDNTGSSYGTGSGDTSLLGYIIAGYGYLLLEKGTDFSFTLSNLGDILILTDGSSEIDRVAYGSFDDGNTADNACQDDYDKGESCSRITDGYDTDVDVDDFKVSENPSKGSTNDDDDNDGYYADVDCNDYDASINPGAEEVCDGQDNDCDGETDEGVLNTYYLDSDSDTYGDLSSAVQACSLPSGYSDNPDDCDDSDASINPGAEEVCDGLDNDCDGETDEGVLITYYEDYDEDTYGNPMVSAQACSAPLGYVLDNTDCDDTDAAINPSGTEIPDNGIDEDCNGYDLDTVAPLPPQNLMISKGSIILSWEPSSSDDVVSYEVYASETVAGFDFDLPLAVLLEDGSVEYSWTDTDAGLYQKRYYIVRAIDSTGLDDGNIFIVGKYSYSLVKPEGKPGKNMVTLPLVPYYSDADGLLEDIGVNCRSVSRFDSSLQKYEGWIKDDVLGSFGVNFPLSYGEAYEVLVDSNTVWDLVGTLS